MPELSPPGANWPSAPQHICPEAIPNVEPGEGEFEARKLDGEYISTAGNYVLLENGTYANIMSFHDETGQQVSHHSDAAFACAVVNGLVYAYSMDLKRTLH